MHCMLPNLKEYSPYYSSEYSYTDFAMLQSFKPFEKNQRVHLKEMQRATRFVLNEMKLAVSKA